MVYAADSANASGMMRSHWKYLDFDDLVGLVVSVLMVVIVGEIVKDEAFEKNKIDPLKKKAQLEDGLLWKLLRPQLMQGLESGTHHSAKLPSIGFHCQESLGS